MFIMATQISSNSILTTLDTLRDNTSFVQDGLKVVNSSIKPLLLGDAQPNNILGETAVREFHELPGTTSVKEAAGFARDKDSLISAFKLLVTQVFTSNSILLRFAAILFPGMKVNFMNNDISWGGKETTNSPNYRNPATLFAPVK